jgi:phosphoribosylformylglycinamidine synthase
MIYFPEGRIFGLMPHPEEYHRYTQHPNWTLEKEVRKQEGKESGTEEGAEHQIFKNAFGYLRKDP